MVWARWRGSSVSKGSGRPWATSQKLQRRVHLSPMIIKVAVPLLKHSGRLGHAASSHTVCSLFSRNISLILPMVLELGILIRIQSGFLKVFSAVLASILMGMRASLSAPRSLEGSLSREWVCVIRLCQDD